MINSLPPSFWTLLQALLSYFDTDIFRDICVHINDYNVFLCLSLRFTAQHGTAGTNGTGNKSSLTALLFGKQKNKQRQKNNKNTADRKCEKHNTAPSAWVKLIHFKKKKKIP